MTPITAHVKSSDLTKGRIGGDSDISSRGQEYANQLAAKIKELDIPNLRVWTSWMNRTIQTAEGIKWAPQER